MTIEVKVWGTGNPENEKTYEHKSCDEDFGKHLRGEISRHLAKPDCWVNMSLSEGGRAIKEITISRVSADEPEATRGRPESPKVKPEGNQADAATAMIMALKEFYPVPEAETVTVLREVADTIEVVLAIREITGLLKDE